MSAIPPASSPPASNLRKRRFPYTPVACDECQRRKIKCTGERPCKGCSDSNAVCLFERNTRFRSHGRRSSNEAASQPSDIAKGRELPPAADTPRGYPLEASEPSVVLPRPGSSDYYLRLAGRFLASSRSQNAEPGQSSGPTRGVDVRCLRRLIHHRSGGASVDILSLLDESQWRDIIRSYEEEVGLQYPFLDLEALRREVQAVHQSAPFTAPRSAHRSPETRRQQQRARDIALLLAAIASILTDPGAIIIANASVEEMHAAALVKTQLGGAERDDLSVLILTSIYFFLSDREVLAWRGIGTVLRQLQELGCHNSGTLPPEAHDEERDRTEKLFWTVYTLDRRWSYGTGLPFAIQDSDIDHDPAFADNSPSSAYLKHMVAYCRIASDVRKPTLEPPTSALAAPDAVRDFLDFRVVEWRRNLPARLQFRGAEDKFNPDEENRGRYRIRLTLYLRGNQMRTIIHRKWAVRPGSSNPNTSNANIMAEIAQDTIRILVALARDTDIYHAQHRTFNHYLQTALSSLLLAVCCTGDVDTTSCLRDAHAAMELVRRLSTESPITRRLLDKLQHVQDTLRDLGARGSADANVRNSIAAPPGRGDGAGIRPSSMSAGTLSLDIAPGPAVTSRAYPADAAYGYVPTPSSASDSVSSAQPGFQPGPPPASLDFTDTQSYLPLMRFPELGEILDEYENNFSF